MRKLGMQSLRPVTEKLGYGECGRESHHESSGSVLVFVTKLWESRPGVHQSEDEFRGVSEFIWVPVLTSLGVDAEGLAVF